MSQMWDPNIHLTKKVILWKNTLLCIIWEFIQPFNRRNFYCKVTTVRDGRLSESQFTRSLWFFPLFWMFNMPVLSRSNHISECQFRNHQAVEAQTIGCNSRVVNRLHYQYNGSQQWSQILWPAYFGRPWFWCSFTFGSGNWLPGLMSNAIFTKACPHPPWFG